MPMLVHQLEASYCSSNAHARASVTSCNPCSAAMLLLVAARNLRVTAVVKRKRRLQQNWAAVQHYASGTTTLMRMPQQMS